MPGSESELVCLGVVGAPHGVKGLVRIRTFTEVPESIAAYGPLTDDAGRVWRLSVAAPWKAGVIARLEGVADRDAAEALRGQKLHVARAALPEPDRDVFYHADLIGLEVRDPDGATLGRVAAVQDFGAGDILEVRRGSGETVMLPFTAAAVPVVDIVAGYLVAAAMPELAAAEHET